MPKHLALLAVAALPLRGDSHPILAVEFPPKRVAARLLREAARDLEGAHAVLDAEPE